MTSEEIKDTYSMEDIISRYGFHSSRSHFICCPFHHEKTGSMRIYKDSYYCFGCGEFGDIFSFVEKMEDVSFKEAFISLGGTYEEYEQELSNRGRFSSRRIKQQMMEQKKTDNNKRKRLNKQRNEVISRIEHLRQEKSLNEPIMKDDGTVLFPDSWCDAVVKLEYELNHLEYLINEIRNM